VALDLILRPHSDERPGSGRRPGLVGRPELSVLSMQTFKRCLGERDQLIRCLPSGQSAQSSVLEPSKGH